MMFTFQRACEIQVLAQSGGTEVDCHRAADSRRCQGDGGSCLKRQGMGGALAAMTLLRKVDHRTRVSLMPLAEIPLQSLAQARRDFVFH